MTKPGHGLFFKRITTEIEWIDLNKEKKWLVQLIDDSGVLADASGGGHFRVVERILEVDSINVNVINPRGSTALFQASVDGHIDIVKLLLKAGGDVNQARSKDGSTPLSLVSSHGDVDIVKVLLDAGANVNQADTTNGMSPLWIASSRGYVDTVKILIESGGDVNQASIKEFGGITGFAPLVIASYKGHIDIVRLLLQHPNIDINKKTTTGDSPLDLATQRNHTEIIQLLKDAGATYTIIAAVAANDMNYVHEWITNDKDKDTKEINELLYAAIIVYVAPASLRS